MRGLTDAGSSAAQAESGGLQASVAESAGELDRITAAWDALAVSRGLPYCAPAWTLSWWRRADRDDAGLRVVAVRERSRLVGLAPFFFRRRPHGPARYRLLAAGVSSRVEPLAAAGREPEVAAALAAALAATEPRPDVVSFEGVRSASLWPQLIARAWPATRATGVVLERSRPAPTTALRGATFEDWLSARSRNFRGQIRRGRRDLEAAGGRFRISRPDELERDLATFARLHHGRWAHRGGSSALSPPVERMLLDAGRALSEDRFRLWCLDLEGETVCTHLHLAAGGELAWWLGGFNHRWARLAPSLQALATAIEDGIARGERRFDLGSGGQPFKYRFADGEDRLDWVTLLPPSPRRALTRAGRVPARARRVVADRFSKELKTRVRTAVRGRPGA